MTITTYTDGHSIQEGTPEELARFMFTVQELQILQSFKNLVDSIPAEMEKQRQKDVVVTIPEIKKKRSTGRKAKKNGET